MRPLYSLNATALLFLACVAQASSAAILGGGPDEAAKAFGEADPKCHMNHCYQRGRYALGTSSGKTNAIFYVWEQSRQFSMEYSRKFANEMVPKDAKKLRSFTKDSGTVVEVFNSKSLAKQFAKPDVWGDAKPGTIVVLHSVGLRKTIISTGEPD